MALGIIERAKQERRERLERSRVREYEGALTRLRELEVSRVAIISRINREQENLRALTGNIDRLRTRAKTLKAELKSDG